MTSSQQPQAPRVPAQQETNRPVEAKGNGEHNQNAASQAAIPKPESPANELSSKRADNGEESSEEGTEYWPPFMGLRLKITDSLLAAFTLLLVLVGIGQGYWLYATVTESNAQHVTSNRAFLFVRSFITGPTSSGETVEFWRITPVIENSGSTPTRRMISLNSAALSDGPLPTDFQFPDTGYPPGTRALRSYNMVGPRAHINVLPIAIPIADILVVANGHKHFYLWGWSDYDDAFEGTKRHRMEYCYEVVVIFDPTNPNNTAAVALSIHHRHNGSDDECYRKPAPYTPPPGGRSEFDASAAC